MANVWRVGFPDDQVSGGPNGNALEQKLVGLLNVEHDSAIVITPDGDVELFMADGISDKRMHEAKSMYDMLMFAVNG